VTLEKSGRLRGCIGSLQAHQPLVQDLAQNAYRAGFKDPRFPPITPEELPDISASISILSAPEQMLFQDEEDLLAQLVPGVDGLILQDGPRRATFLPQVWEQLPDPKQFISHLKRKAGMAEDHWSPTVTASRYRVVKVQ
jgi:AmmeMemoRadiSam system protein A